MTQHIGGVLTRQENHVTSVRPVNLLGADINLTDEFTRFPIIKQDSRVATLDSDHLSTEQALRRRCRRLDNLRLLEVLEYLDTRGGFPDGIVARSRSRPNEVQGLSEGLVTEGLGGVDDELTITADCNEATIAIVLEHLGIQLTRSKVTGDDGQALTVGQAIIVAATTGQTTNGGGLNVIVGGPNDLAGGIHRGDGIVATKLDADATLIEADGKHVGFLGGSQGPGTLHAIV
mmetsp:Transcript_34193/g.75220  ORF Transcript_34193/g.75220 Transcript_34193/m.75220 type:complete len:232 (+) Transcript_34193:648-1343(+)